MSSDAQQPAHRARAVADAPVAPLLARTDELARRWAIGLIVSLPLERIGEVPLEGVAREAPAFLAQLLRALGSDAELARLSDPPSALPGARGGQAAVEAIEALRGVLWEALLDELRLPSFHSAPARLIADLADRLAYVSTVALGSTLARVPDPEKASAEGAGWAAPEVTIRRHEPPAPAAGARPPARGAPSPSDVAVEPPEHAVRASLGGGVAIVDEAEPALRRSARAPAAAQPEPAAAPGRQRQAQAVAGGGHARGRARPWDIPLDGAAEPDY